MRLAMKRVEGWAAAVCVVGYLLAASRGNERVQALLPPLFVGLFYSVYLARRAFFAKRPVDREFHKPLFFIVAAVTLLMFAAALP